MARKRFSKEEKSVIADALPVEWQNVTQWHPGILAGGIAADADGWQYVTVTNMAGTARLSKGAVIRVSPGHIRRAA